MSEMLDCRGMKCPQPVLKVAIKANSLEAGSSLEVLADCESFPEDITKWCEDQGKVLMNIVDNGSFHTATVQL